MNESWWESPACFVCNYGWVLLLALVLGLAAFFTRNTWLPALGYQPEPATALPATLYAPPQATLGTGDIQVTLTWTSANDLDLWVTDPSGEAIYYRHPLAQSAGLLDYDANADCLEISTQPVENIFWPPGKAPKGRFRVEVQYYRQCMSPAATAYRVRLLVDGAVTEYNGEIQAQGDRLLVHAFER